MRRVLDSFHLSIANSSSIPPHLGNLSFLVSLDLSGNNYQGNQPGDLSRLRCLWFMNFKLNNFTGDNPSWFGSFPELKFLSIRNNSFTGFIPHSRSLKHWNYHTILYKGLYHPPFSTFQRWKLLLSQEITYLVIFLQTCAMIFQVSEGFI
nr:leucine-rich repeat receptor protein kinase EMS1-like [Coffea arabica]